MGYRSERKGTKLKQRQVGSWTHHFFWVPTPDFEVNAWACFHGYFEKIKKGKSDSNERYRKSIALPFYVG